MIVEEIKKVEPRPSQENLNGQIKWVLLGNMLIIGNFMDHTYMVMEALLSHLEFGEAFNKVDEYSREVVAAGVANKDGSMDTWESTGFRVKTPHHLRNDLGSIVREVILNEQW